MTPKDYRAMADQCLHWMHDAHTIDERRAYLKLARAWLQAALDEGDAIPAMPPASRLLRVSSAARNEGAQANLASAR